VYHIRKIGISLACLITAALLASISATAEAQTDGDNIENSSSTPQSEDSVESIPELRLRIKKLVQELQDKKRIKKEEEQLTPPPSLNDNSEESDTPQASQVFRTPKTSLPTDVPQTTEAPEVPTAPQNPEQTQTPVTQQDPKTPKIPENTQDSGAQQAPEKTQHPVSPPPVSSDTPEKTTKLAAPGKFEVDEESAQRALERTLVQSGALLLQSGQIDFETSLNFARNQKKIPVFFERDGTSFLSTDELRDSILLAAFQLRMGLPFESQLEFGLPYQYIDSSSVTRIGNQIASESSSTNAATGDITLSIAKTLLKEKGPRPDVIARFNWDADNGDKNVQDDSLGAGSGHNEFGGSLTITKRQDPLIFTANLNYEYAKAKHSVQPGESLGFSIGTVLAASPETSIRIALNQTFVGETEINNQKIFGSDRVIGALTLSASSVLDRRNFMNVSVEMGLTDDATDYSLNIAYIRRFSGLF